MPIFPLVPDATPIPVSTDVLMHETQHTAIALDKLLSQYKGKPRIAALISAFTDECQEIEDVLWDLLTKRLDIDNSEGAQLDIIGKIVKQPRNGLSDVDYRVFLKVRIRVNLSTGTPEDMLAIAALLGLTIKLDEQYPAGIVLKVLTTLTLNPQALLTLFRQADPIGVRTLLEYDEVDPTHAITYGDSNFPSTSTTLGMGDATNPATGGHAVSVIG